MIKDCQKRNNFPIRHILLFNRNCNNQRSRSDVSLNYHFINSKVKKKKIQKDGMITMNWIQILS